MEILINEERIDYSLERERNLLEVFDGLRAWLTREGYVITSARCDDTELDLQGKERLSGILVEEIDELDIEVEQVSGRVLANLRTLRSYFSLLAGLLDRRDFAALGELLRGHAQVRESLDAILEESGIAAPGLSAAELERLVAAGSRPDGASEARSELVAFAERLARELTARIDEIADPLGSLRRVSAGLKASIAELADVPIMLQTGKDRDAMAAIVRFTEVTGSVVRLIPLLPAEAPPIVPTDFNAILLQLVDAFIAKDSVLIGDLLEYEIAPRLEKLSAYVDLISKER